MISHGICHSLSGLLPLVWSSLTLSMLLQMALFHSFYGWVIFHCMYVLHHSFIPLLMDWFYLLITVNEYSLLQQIFVVIVVQLCPTLCDPMDCSMPGFPDHHHPLELAQTHAHWVGDGTQSSHPLLSPSPPAFSLSQHQGLFQWVGSSYQVAKVLEIQLQHQSFQWIVSNSLQPRGLYSPWNSPGQNTGVGSLSLLQQIFPTQELNQNLLHCRQVLYQLSYQGNPVNIQDWFSLGFIGLISLSKGLSRVFSSITAWTYQFFSTQSS